MVRARLRPWTVRPPMAKALSKLAREAGEQREVFLMAVCFFPKIFVKILWKIRLENFPTPMPLTTYRKETFL